MLDIRCFGKKAKNKECPHCQDRAPRRKLIFQFCFVMFCLSYRKLCSVFQRFYQLLMSLNSHALHLSCTLGTSAQVQDNQSFTTILEAKYEVLHSNNLFYWCTLKNHISEDTSNCPSDLSLLSELGADQISGVTMAVLYWHLGNFMNCCSACAPDQL